MLMPLDGACLLLVRVQAHVCVCCKVFVGFYVPAFDTYRAYK